MFGEHAGIDEVVHGTIDNLTDRGASTVEVSISHLEYAVPAWLAIGTTEFGAYLDARNIPYWSQSGYSFPLFAALQQGLSEHADELGDPIRDVWLQAAVMRDVFGNEHYGRAQKVRELLTAGVQRALSEVDVLASPTLPMMPPRLEEGFGDVATVVGNTGPFNLTGHPAISINAGRVDSLPVGIQFVSPKHTEGRLFRTAACVEAW
jgi:Asp-tRNA(Asn)/Glu-tRNA(Gln) amidotransferase A subunit family amidase